jgi:hypothetical protein
MPHDGSTNWCSILEHGYHSFYPLPAWRVTCTNASAMCSYSALVNPKLGHPIQWASKSKGQSLLPSVDVVASINQSEEMQNTRLCEKRLKPSRTQGNSESFHIIDSFLFNLVTFLSLVDKVRLDTAVAKICPYPSAHAATQASHRHNNRSRNEVV